MYRDDDHPERDREGDEPPLRSRPHQHRMRTIPLEDLEEDVPPTTTNHSDNIELTSSLESVSQELCSTERSLQNAKSSLESVSQELCPTTDKAHQSASNSLESVSQELWPTDRPIQNVRNSLELVSQELYPTERSMQNERNSLESVSQELYSRERSIQNARNSLESVSQELYPKERSIQNARNSLESVSQKLCPTRDRTHQSASNSLESVSQELWPTDRSIQDANNSLASVSQELCPTDRTHQSASNSLESVSQELCPTEISIQNARNSLESVSQELSPTDRTHQSARNSLESVSQELCITNRSMQNARNSLGSVSQELWQTDITKQLARKRPAFFQSPQVMPICFTRNYSNVDEVSSAESWEDDVSYTPESDWKCDSDKSLLGSSRAQREPRKRVSFADDLPTLAGWRKLEQVVEDEEKETRSHYPLETSDESVDAEARGSPTSGALVSRNRSPTYQPSIYLYDDDAIYRSYDDDDDEMYRPSDEEVIYRTYDEDAFYRPSDEEVNYRTYDEDAIYRPYDDDDDDVNWSRDGMFVGSGSNSQFYGREYMASPSLTHHASPFDLSRPTDYATFENYRIPGEPRLEGFTRDETRIWEGYGHRASNPARDGRYALPRWPHDLRSSTELLDPYVERSRSDTRLRRYDNVPPSKTSFDVWQRPSEGGVYASTSRAVFPLHSCDSRNSFSIRLDRKTPPPDVAPRGVHASLGIIDESLEEDVSNDFLPDCESSDVIFVERKRAEKFPAVVASSTEVVVATPSSYPSDEYVVADVPSPSRLGRDSDDVVYVERNAPDEYLATRGNQRVIRLNSPPFSYYNREGNRTGRYLERSRREPLYSLKGNSRERFHLPRQVNTRVYNPRSLYYDSGTLIPSTRGRTAGAYYKSVNQRSRDEPSDVDLSNGPSSRRARTVGVQTPDSAATIAAETSSVNVLRADDSSSTTRPDKSIIPLTREAQQVPALLPVHETRWWNRPRDAWDVYHYADDAGVSFRDAVLDGSWSSVASQSESSTQQLARYDSLTSLYVPLARERAHTRLSTSNTDVSSSYRGGLMLPRSAAVAAPILMPDANTLLGCINQTRALDAQSGSDDEDIFGFIGEIKRTHHRAATPVGQRATGGLEGYLDEDTSLESSSIQMKDRQTLGEISMDSINNDGSAFDLDEGRERDSLRFDQMMASTNPTGISEESVEGLESDISLETKPDDLMSYKTLKVSDKHLYDRHDVVNESSDLLCYDVVSDSSNLIAESDCSVQSIESDAIALHETKTESFTPYTATVGSSEVLFDYNQSVEAIESDTIALHETKTESFTPYTATVGSSEVLFDYNQSVEAIESNTIALHETKTDSFTPNESKVGSADIQFDYDQSVEAIESNTIALHETKTDSFTPESKVGSADIQFDYDQSVEAIESDAIALHETKTDSFTPNESKVDSSDIQFDYDQSVEAIQSDSMLLLKTNTDSLTNYITKHASPNEMDVPGPSVDNLGSKVSLDGKIEPEDSDKLDIISLKTKLQSLDKISYEKQNIQRTFAQANESSKLLYNDLDSESSNILVDHSLESVESSDISSQESKIDNSTSYKSRVGALNVIVESDQSIETIGSGEDLEAKSDSLMSYLEDPYPATPDRRSSYDKRNIHGARLDDPLALQKGVEDSVESVESSKLIEIEKSASSMIESENVDRMESDMVPIDLVAESYDDFIEPSRLSGLTSQDELSHQVGYPLVERSGEVTATQPLESQEDLVTSLESTDKGHPTGVSSKSPRVRGRKSTSSTELIPSGSREINRSVSQTVLNMRLPVFPWRFEQRGEGTEDGNDMEAADKVEEPKRTLRENLTHRGGVKSAQVEYYGVPKKAMSDKKQYSLMRLVNGIKVLLIEDVHDTRPKMELGQRVTLKMNIPTGAGGDHVTFKPEGAATPPRAYVGLSVDVGSFSDGGVAGLAHFVEHLVFMGSHKYPGDNAFDSFIRDHGGCDNATTDSEYTTFYFICEQQFLPRALLQFCELIKNPQMRKKSLRSEREILDSEFEWNKVRDSSRLQQLYSTMTKPGHLAARFTWGNRQTLRKDINESCLHLSVRNFHARHYSANRMGLAVRAQMPTSCIEELVHRTFSTVESNRLPPDDLDVFRNAPFDTPDFHRFYQVLPATDKHHRELVLTWALPPVLKHYRVKPLRYIAMVLSHAGDGSLVRHLEDKCWVDEVVVNGNTSGFEENSIFTLFSVNIQLTRSGAKHVSEIVWAVLAYIALLQRAGPSERSYREMQLLEGIRFVERDLKLTHNYDIETIAENLLRFHLDDVLVGRDLLLEYDEQVISQFLDLLVPETVNIILLMEQDNTNYDLKERWFETRYTVSDIPRAWLDPGHGDVTKDGLFRLPTSNKYLTRSYEMLRGDVIAASHPVKVYENRTLEMWFKQDTRWGRPFAFYCLYFESPVGDEPINAAIMLDVLIEWLRMRLTKTAQGATEATLHYSVQKEEHGFIVFVNGFNEKLPLVVQAVLDSIVEVRCGNVAAEEFEETLRDKRRIYKNIFMKPEKLNREVRFTLTLQPYYSSVCKHSRLGHVTLTTFCSYARLFFDHVRVHCLVEGNVSSKMAVLAITTAFKALVPGPFYPMPLPDQRVVVLKPGTKTARVHNLDPSDPTCVITHYYQSGHETLRRGCLARIVQALMQDEWRRAHPRDREGLQLDDRVKALMQDEWRRAHPRDREGLQVDFCMKEVFGVVGFHVRATFGTHEYSMDRVDMKLDSFVNKTFVRRVKHMKPQLLGLVVRDLVQQGVNPEPKLESQVNRDFNEIITKKYMFDRIERQRAVYAQITADEIRRFVVDHFNASSQGTNFRRLKVQIVGCRVLDEVASDPKLTLERRRGECKIYQSREERRRRKKEKRDKKNFDSYPDDRSTYEFQVVKTKDEQCISHFQRFKSTLELYPLISNEEQSERDTLLNKSY